MANPAIAPALITGAGSLLGGLAGGLFGKSSAKSQMRFQERMANTAHQRQVKDLRAAGLNPILSANSGAAAPGGAMSTMGDIVTPAVSTALATRRANQELENMNAQEDLLWSQNKAAAAQANKTRMETAMLPFQIMAQAEQQTSAAQANRANAQWQNMRNAIVTGDRDLLISTLGTNSTVLEVVRKALSEGAKGVGGTSSRSNIFQALQSAYNLLFNEGPIPGGLSDRKPYKAGDVKNRREAR
jgi:hypothetical protein